MINPSINYSKLTNAELTVIQAIAGGTYFVENETPTGVIDGENTTFTLSFAPNPTTSLKVYLNGQRFKNTGTDYTLLETTLTMTTAPDVGSILTVDYHVSPV